MAGQYFGGFNSIYILWSNQLGNQSNQSHEKYSWNFYSRLDLSLWIIFFCSCVLGEGLDEGMDILHEMILSNRRRRRQNASNHIGPPKPQRRKVRRSQSTYHWQKPFFLLWQNLKWQKISICKWDTFLTHDMEKRLPLELSKTILLSICTWLYFTKLIFELDFWTWFFCLFQTWFLLPL